MTEGHFRCYEPRNFGPRKLDLIGRANHIIEEYESKGHQMTVRQIYYQMVQRNWIPNVGSSYDRLQETLSEGRLAGLVSWTAIEDRGRNLQGLDHSRSIGDAISHARAAYRLDLWADQQWRPEVWIEKEALVGVIGGICNRLRVDFFACKGYNSQSEQWRAGRRFADRVARGQRPIVFHLGDHDPSGIDMTRDNRERLTMFAGVPVTVQRLALNMSQIEELRPPPNPAKLSDSRAADYVRQYGDSSWELDALDPVYIERLIRDAVVMLRDPTVWDQSLARENEDHRMMDEMIQRMG